MSDQYHDYDDFLDARDIAILEKHYNDLPRGFQAHADELLRGGDPTGGMVPIHEQFNLLMSQATARP